MFPQLMLLQMEMREARLCKAKHRQLPVVDVVILASPPPVLVGEAVDLQKLFFAQA